MQDEVIWKESIFRTTCEAVSKCWAVFNNLRDEYKSLSTQQKKESNLSKSLSSIHDIEEVLD